MRLHARPYDGDASFLADATIRTLHVLGKVRAAAAAEALMPGRVLGVFTDRPSTITAFEPGYIDRDREVIVGLQTPVLLGRAIKPFGGYKMVQQALAEIGAAESPHVRAVFGGDWGVRTHNDGVFGIYTPEMRAARRAALLTGLPDGYGRGRLIGDYRRVALHGVDELIRRKQAFLDLRRPDVDGAPAPAPAPAMTGEALQLREEVSMQIRALRDMRAMAAEYGQDISRPARTAREAVQWLYLAYLAAVKVQDGAAMSLGRIDAFLDTYFERDALPEEEAQEIIDDFVLKLRSVRHLRTGAYNELFSGDPTWVTLSLGGTCAVDPSGPGAGRRHMVTRTTYRFLRTLDTLGPAPEPNMTVLWHADLLPEAFKRYCADLSVRTSSLQYENDALMSERFGDDYAISCCVSAMRVGEDMQYFGARANAAKLLLYAINGGRDEISGEQVGPRWWDLGGRAGGAALHELRPLRIDDVVASYRLYIEWLARLYAETMNAIHWSHDKYAYEAVQMALHDEEPRRLMAFGLAGLSVAADSLAAIEHASVFPVFADGEDGGHHPTLPADLVVDYDVQAAGDGGPPPRYGNDDPAADRWARWITETFAAELRRHPLHRGAEPTLSVLTITSNVVYGKNTGSTPDGRRAGAPFAPGANALHGRDTRGAIASLNSVAGLDYDTCLDGISNTLTLSPGGLGKSREDRVSALAGLLDGYFASGGHHVNINVLDAATLRDAQAHPERYPNLTIRVSGYAVNFHKLTREQQDEVMARSCHDHSVPA